MTRVVFPHPDGPITAFIAPLLNETLAESRMGWELPWGNTVRFLQLSMEGAKISVEVRFLFKLNEAMRNFKALIAAATAFAAISAGAVEIDNAAIKNKSKFGIVFPDNTSYYANADAVVSVSRQNYCAGPLEITEVVIDVLGSPSQVRIYCARAADAAKTAERLAQEKLPEPLKPYAKTPDSIRERVSEAQKLAAGASAVPQIQKIFPATTNSRTIEFIVPSPEELAEELDIPVDKISDTLKVSGRHISVDAPFVEGEDNSLLDVLVNDDSPIADRSLIDESLSKEIDRALQLLQPREREIVKMVFGIGCQEMTLEEIGDKFGLTRERVRQIKEKAIRHLRQKAQSQLLRSYLG